MIFGSIWRVCVFCLQFFEYCGFYWIVPRSYEVRRYWTYLHCGAELVREVNLNIGNSPAGKSNIYRNHTSVWRPNETCSPQSIRNQDLHVKVKSAPPITGVIESEDSFPGLQSNPIHTVQRAIKLSSESSS